MHVVRPPIILISTIVWGLLLSLSSHLLHATDGCPQGLANELRKLETSLVRTGIKVEEKVESFEGKLPHEILGVARDANVAEIKSAHRRLARKYHPDIVGPGKEKEFRAIENAYRSMTTGAGKGALSRWNAAETAFIKKHGLDFVAGTNPAAIYQYLGFSIDIEEAIARGDFKFFHSFFNGLNGKTDLRNKTELKILFRDLGDREPNQTTRTILYLVLNQQPHSDALTYMLMRHVFSVRANTIYGSSYRAELLGAFLSKASESNIYEALSDFNLPHEMLTASATMDVIMSQVRAGNHAAGSALFGILSSGNYITPGEFELIQEVLAKQPKLFNSLSHLSALHLFRPHLPTAKPGFFYHVWDSLNESSFSNFNGWISNPALQDRLTFYDLALLKNDSKILKIFADGKWLKHRLGGADPGESFRAQLAQEALAIQDSGARFDYMMSRVSPQAQKFYHDMSEARRGGAP